MENQYPVTVIRVAVTGPESTGKSRLAEELAGFFQTAWVPEYARSYLHGLPGRYGPDDILNIARGQLAWEELALPGARHLLFCDTEPLVTKIWAENAFGQCPGWILQQLDTKPHDYYLLCNIDLPWEYDPLREHPDRRAHFFQLYYNELIVRRLPFEVVSGAGPARLQHAIHALRARFPFLPDATRCKLDRE